MNRQWRNRSIGICVGILLFLAGYMAARRNNAEISPDAAVLETQQKEETEVKEEQYSDNIRGIKISDYVRGSEKFVSELLLYQYIEYGVRKYNEDNQKTEQYSVDIEKNLLPYDTKFSMSDSEKKPYRVDLAKEIIPELANNIYNFELQGQAGGKLYMSINTYNMKIYIYDALYIEDYVGQGVGNNEQQRAMDMFIIRFSRIIKQRISI